MTGIHILRWWAIRKDGIANVVGAVSNLSLMVSGLMHGNSKQEIQVRNLIVRYGLLAHALLYYQATVTTKRKNTRSFFVF